jgi:hypothetical protein
VNGDIDPIKTGISVHIPTILDLCIPYNTRKKSDFSKFEVLKHLGSIIFNLAMN